MNRFKTGLIVLATVAATTSSIVASASSWSGYSYSARATRSIITLKPVKLYEVTVGRNESQNRFELVGELTKYSVFKISPWMMSTGGGYVVKGGDVQPDSKHFYFVIAGKHNHWYERYTDKRFNALQRAADKKAKKEAKAKAKEKAEEKKEAAEDWAELKAVANKNPMITPQYTFTNDQDKLDNANYYRGDKIIFENYRPTDSNAVLPTGAKLVSGLLWGYEPNGNTSDNIYDGNTYLYLDRAHAKKNGYDNAGWVVYNHTTSDYDY